MLEATLYKNNEPANAAPSSNSLKPLIFRELPWTVKSELAAEFPIINFTTLRTETVLRSQINASSAPEHYKLQQALFNSGFFYIEEYNIDEKELEEFCNISRAFLSQDETYKKQFYYNQAMFGYAPLGTESIAKTTKTGEYVDYCQKLSWQKDKTLAPNADFARRWTTLFNKLTLISKILLEHIVMVLDLNESQTATLQKMLDGEGILRYLHYNSIPQNYNEPIRMAPHNDLGFITLLFQVPAKNGIPSLEAKINGAYKSVPPIRNTFVVNLGEALSYISSGKIKATIHQVTAPPEQHRGPDSERTSIPFFFTPKKDAMLTPVKETTFKSHYDSSNQTGSITFQQLLDRVVNGLHISSANSDCSSIKAKL